MSDMDLPLERFNPNVQVYAVANPSLGDYELIGPGFLSILTDEVDAQTVYYLEAKNKQGETLMLSRMRKENNYEKQKGSVIAWRDGQQRVHSELALSFSEDNECDFIWRLICEKIGKNYLQISGRQALEMPREDNLEYILDKTKTAKDMVEYHILNSQQFIQKLSQTFDSFRQNNDKISMQIICHIIESILTNLDHRLVQKLFADPSFQLLLEVQKFNSGIDYPQLWLGKIKIKKMVTFSETIETKIQLIHRISFYRENILNLAKETYFQHILMMTQTECYKDVIIELTRGETIQKLLEMTALPHSSTLSLKDKDNAEDQTFPPEGQCMRKRILFEKKIQFIMEAILMLKQIQSQNIKIRFIERMFNQDVMKMISQTFDQNILRSMDFIHCLAQASPLKFFQYLRQHYRLNPADNLLLKLSKKYCLGTEDFQSGILEVFKTLGDPLKSKDNLGFLTGTFLAYVFECCRDERAVLMLLCQAQSLLDNIQGLFEVCLKHKLFYKLTTFLRNAGRDKQSQLRSVKILKRILLENALSMRGSSRDLSVRLSGELIAKLNNEIIESGYFQYCLQVLSKYISFNNVISSSMLENLRIISDFKKYGPYQQYIQRNRVELEHLQKYLGKILQAREEMGKKRVEIPASHRVSLEQEQQELYLMGNQQQKQIIQGHDKIDNKEQIEKQMAAVKKLTQQLEQQRREEEKKEKEEEEPAGISRKRRKENVEETPVIMIQLKLDFDEPEGNQ